MMGYALPLLSETPPHWPQVLVEDFDAFLQDHAACEKKAAALAMSLVVKYPDREALIDPMVSLAREELEHFQQVFRIMQKRQLSLHPKDIKDVYIQKILPHLRHGRETRLLDQLVMSALVEARGYERFGLLGEALSGLPDTHRDASLAAFYKDLAKREAGHYRIFIRVAQVYFSQVDIDEALHRLALIEAESLASTPFGPRLH